MDKAVLVEYYAPDGSVEERRMRKSEFRRCKWCNPDRPLEAGEFFVVYRDLKKRWDGSRMMTLWMTRSAPGFRVDFVESKGQAMPVVVPCDD